MSSPKYDLLPPFFDAVVRVKVPVSENSDKRIPEMGLIICETEDVSFKEVSKKFPSGTNALSVVLRSGSGASSFFEAFAEANEKGSWLYIDVEDDPTPEIIGILKEISETGALTREGVKIPFHEMTRVIAIVRAETLEKKITYPYFMEMFGPIARI